MGGLGKLSGDREAGPVPFLPAIACEALPF